MNGLRICFISGDISRSGGTERVGLLIANELCKRKYDVTILSFWNGGKPYFFCDNKIKLTYLLDRKKEGKLYRTYIYPILKLRRFIKKNKFDVIIDIDTALSFYSCYASKYLECKVVTWEHFNYIQTQKDKNRYRGFCAAKKYSARIVVLTKHDYDMYINLGHIETERMTQIYNPVSFQIEPTSVDSKLAISVGRLSYQKGFDLLLNAWAIIEKHGTDWRLAIIGSGEDERALKKLSKNLNLKNVDFIANTPDIKKWYRSASLYILSSRYEGFPMVLLEAMSKGVPIVSFDCVTGPSEMIKNNVNGFLVEDGNVEALATQVYALISTDREQLAELSYNSIKLAKDFSVENIVNNWESILQELV